MKKLTVILLTFCCTSLFGQVTEKDTCLVGIYLKALYDLSPSEYSIGADFYIWINSTDSASLFDQLEITNAKKIDEYSNFNGKDSNNFVRYENCKAQLTHNWNLRNYPFDKQRLEITMEAQEALEFESLSDDINGFQISKELKIPGWKISKNYVSKSFVTYPSDFGYHYTKLEDKRWNRLAFVIEISRDGWGLYFKLFTGLYIAFLVSFLAFFIKADYVDPRFGLSIGGLFASVANKYVVDANIPATISFSFVDMVHFVSFIFIFATLVISGFSLSLFSKGKIQESKSLDRKSSRIVMLLYLIINVTLILIASLS